MRNIYLLDCTLRDGGYINDWHFGEKAIKNITKKMEHTGVEFLELGFIRPGVYNSEYSLFDGNESVSHVIGKKSVGIKYVGMIDMGNPVSLSYLGKCIPEGFDVLRVIFKKDKAKDAYDYIGELVSLGYEVFVQPVGADRYTIDEFTTLIQQFNSLKISAFYIVDSFGVLKKNRLLQLAEAADCVLRHDIMLGYHSHNNMQQAMGNAVAMTEMKGTRDIILDACVFGMGRGAGNLNMELFAEFMNENFGRKYRIEPMLEIIDEYLNDIYRERFWGYSMPLYLSAVNECHPNYAIYFSSKGTLTMKSYNEILKNISEHDKYIYSVDRAEYYYQQYQKHYIDDRGDVEKLKSCLADRHILLLGSGNTLLEQKAEIEHYINEVNPIIIALNFTPQEYLADYVFCCHMRRYKKLIRNQDTKIIVTSNLREAKSYHFMLNLGSYSSKYPEILENSGIVCLNFLIHIGVTKVMLAGLDGYETAERGNYLNSGLEYTFTKEEIENRNALIKSEIEMASRNIQISFLTKSSYDIDNVVDKFDDVGNIT